MNKSKLLVTLLLALALLSAQVGQAAAAPLAQTGTVTGTILSITPETDSSNVTTFLVEVQTDPVAQTTQTVRISLADAIALGLVDPATNLPFEGENSQVGQPIELTADQIIPDTTGEEPQAVHPIAALLAAFFDEDPAVIDALHSEDGFGFGVIAQALWMSKHLTDDASLVDEILQAKQAGSGTFTLMDGTEITYTNWGQLRKALLDKHDNLGSVVSGKAEEDGSQPGNGHGNGNGGGNGNGHGNGNGGGQENGNGKGKGHNKP